MQLYVEKTFVFPNNNPLSRSQITAVLVFLSSEIVTERENGILRSWHFG